MNPFLFLSLLVVVVIVFAILGKIARGTKPETNQKRPVYNRHTGKWNNYR